jgi:DNA-binding SARP family transcriptional activator
MEFKILGPLEVRRGDELLSCKSPKQRLLLAVLLLRPNEVVSSDRLIEALWGDEPPATAQKALQVHVSQLRTLLEPDRSPGGAGSVLLTRPPGYELRLEPGQLDLQRFEASLAEAMAASALGDPGRAARILREALALWHGQPLADSGFEDFLQGDIARLEELRLTAIEHRIAADLELGGHAALIGELQRLASDHPLRERIRAQLMLALYRSGRQAEALEEYRDARRTLVEELGIEPTRGLTDLERRILVQDTELDTPAVPQQRARAADGPAAGLIGRERELAMLTTVLERALTGTGALVLVGGEPGIGKSRLAEALAAAADERGARVAVGRSWEAGGAPPFWPWVQALRSYLRDAEPGVLREHVARAGPELVAILPELRELLPDLPPPGALDSPDTRFRLFESVASFLTSASRDEPLALFLDDLHAADATSLLLLRFVAASLADARVLIVGCYRDTEAGPALTETLAELAREPVVERVTLRGLGKRDVAQLLESVIGATPDDELAARVHAETQGNPLYAGEIARLLASEGATALTGGVLPIPEGVREAIRRRLQRQSESCRDLLILASVLGREFDLATIVEVGGLDVDALLATLEEAATARLIGNVPGTAERLRFSHILVRDTLYDDLPAPRRLRLHRRAGEAIEALHSGNPGPHVAELAHHFIAAGSLGTEKAGEYAERAGHAAAAQHGYEEAAGYYALALELLERRATPDAGTRCDLLLALGEVLSRAGSGADAKEALRRAAAIAEERGWHDRLARAALAYGGRFAWARASTDPALVPILEGALEAVGGRDAPARARLLARLAAAIRDEASRERRVALAEEAVDIARRSDDLVTLAYALEGYWVAAEGADPAREGLAIGNQLIALGEQLGDKERVFTGHDFRLNAFWKLADRAGVDVEVESLTRLADDLRQPAQSWHVGSSRTMLALMEGRLEDAEQLIAQTRAAGERAEGWNAVVSQRLQLFVLRREQGRLAEIDDTIRRSVHEYPTLMRFRCALAHLHAELADEPAARAALDDLLSLDLGREHLDAEWLFSMSLLPNVCSFLADEDAAATLYALLAPCDGLYTEAPIEATFGAMARGLGVLATTLGRFDDAQRHFEAAIAAERGMGARPWLAHAQHDMAAMLLTRGGPGDGSTARSLLGDALTTYRALGMQPWAARASALGRALSS